MAGPALALPWVVKAFLIKTGVWALYRAYPELMKDAVNLFGFSKRSTRILLLIKDVAAVKDMQQAIAICTTIDALCTDIKTDETLVEKHLAFADRLQGLKDYAFKNAAYRHCIQPDQNPEDDTPYHDLFVNMFSGLFVYGRLGQRFSDSQELGIVIGNLTQYIETLRGPDDPHSMKVKSVLQTLLPTKTAELKALMKPPIKDQTDVSIVLVGLTDAQECVGYKWPDEEQYEMFIDCVLYALNMDNVDQPDPTGWAAHLQEHYVSVAEIY